MDECRASPVMPGFLIQVWQKYYGQQGVDRGIHEAAGLPGSFAKK